MNDEDRRAVQAIFDACQQLTASTGRPFSPDGHLVGSLGEVLAADLLGLTLMPPSNAGYDAVDTEGRKVEIKSTTRRSVGLSASGTSAERLVVLAIGDGGEPTVVYDGPTEAVWEAAGKPQKNGQRTISLSRLRQIPIT
jgi:ABC-type Fe3+-hydroxamate transport system substrate-binding protein